MTLLSQEQLHDLANGKNVLLSNGMTLRARQEPDEDTSISDYEDCYGLIEFFKRSAYLDEPETRPDHFDDNAEIIHFHRDPPAWWQPPADIVGNENLMSNTRRILREIVDFGFSRWVLELCDGYDAYGKNVVRDYESVGGVEPLLSDDDLIWTLNDLAHELFETYDLDTSGSAN